VTFSSNGAEDEQRVFNEIAKRLEGLELVFD
jgi:hypothetical protein